MKLFRKKETVRAVPEIAAAQRSLQNDSQLPPAVEPFEKELYDRLRFAVPIIDAALMKMIRLTGGFQVLCSDPSLQQEQESP